MIIVIINIFSEALYNNVFMLEKITLWAKNVGLRESDYGKEKD